MRALILLPSKHNAYLLLVPQKRLLDAAVAQNNHVHHPYLLGKDNQFNQAGLMQGLECQSQKKSGQSGQTGLCRTMHHMLLL
jgi:hypothetical protein